MSLFAVLEVDYNHNHWDCCAIAVSIKQYLILTIIETKTLSIIGVTSRASAVARVIRKGHTQQNLGQIL